MTVLSVERQRRSAWEFWMPHYNNSRNLDSESIHPCVSSSRIDSTALQNSSQLHTYLGLLNYYRRFFPNLTPLLHPLYQLHQPGNGQISVPKDLLKQRQHCWSPKPWHILILPYHCSYHVTLLLVLWRLLFHISCPMLKRTQLCLCHARSTKQRSTMPK